MKTRSLLVGLFVAVLALFVTESVQAQCGTCTTPTLGYQATTYQVASPVVSVPVRTRWYPGKYLFGRWRNRGLTAQQTYAVGYAPYTPAYNSYTAAYAPYTAGYAPAAVNYGYRPYTVGYGAYRVGFANVATPTVTNAAYVTSYAPLTPACSTCAQTVARPVVVQRVAAPCCNTCSYDPCSCNTCSTGSACCATGLSQTSYAEPTCSSCTPATTVVPSTPTPVPSSSGLGPATSQPQLNGTAVPYNAQSPVESGAGETQKADPGPAQGTDSSTYYYEMRAPRLLDPTDRTAQLPSSHRGPTVDVKNAVYSQRVRSSAASVRLSGPSQAEIDAQGWTAVPQ